MSRTNVFTNERAAIRKRVADAGEALRRALKKTNKFLAKHNITSAGDQKEAYTLETAFKDVGISATKATIAMQKLAESTRKGVVRIPPRIRYLATRHKKARVRKKNQKRIRKIMYGGKK